MNKLLGRKQNCTILHLAEMVLESCRKRLLKKAENLLQLPFFESVMPDIDMMEEPCID
jgi:hypothetical protein